MLLKCSAASALESVAAYSRTCCRPSSGSGSNWNSCSFDMMLAACCCGVEVLGFQRGDQMVRSRLPGCPDAEVAAAGGLRFGGMWGSACSRRSQIGFHGLGCLPHTRFVRCKSLPFCPFYPLWYLVALLLFLPSMNPHLFVFHFTSLYVSLMPMHVTLFFVENLDRPAGFRLVSAFRLTTRNPLLRRSPGSSGT